MLNNIPPYEIFQLYLIDGHKCYRNKYRQQKLHHKWNPYYTLLFNTHDNTVDDYFPPGYNIGTEIWYKHIFNNPTLKYIIASIMNIPNKENYNTYTIRWNKTPGIHQLSLDILHTIRRNIPEKLPEIIFTTSYLIGDNKTLMKHFFWKVWLPIDAATFIMMTMKNGNSNRECHPKKL